MGWAEGWRIVRGGRQGYTSLFKQQPCALMMARAKGGGGEGRGGEGMAMGYLLHDVCLTKCCLIVMGANASCLGCGIH